MKKTILLLLFFFYSSMLFAEWVIPKEFNDYEDFIKYMRVLIYIKELPNFDEWQTPEETYIRGGGDCEDLVLLAAHILIYKFDRTDVWLCIGYNHVWLYVGGYSFECTAGFDTCQFRPPEYALTYWEFLEIAKEFK